MYAYVPNGETFTIAILNTIFQMDISAKSPYPKYNISGLDEIYPQPKIY